MGMERINHGDTYIANKRDGTETYHANDQIFAYRLDVEMVVQIRRLGADIMHESPHDMLIFKVKKQLPKLRISTIQLPEGKDQRDKFVEELGIAIDNGVGTRIQKLHNAIKQVSTKLKLIRTTKGYRKLKFYWSAEDYDEYKRQLREAYDVKRTNPELFRTRLKSARHFWMALKQKYWSEYVDKCVADRKHFAHINLLARARIKSSEDIQLKF